MTLPDTRPLTPRAELVMRLADDEAGRLGDTEVAPQHILRAMLREGESIAAGVLESLIRPDRVTSALDFIEGRSQVSTQSTGPDTRPTTPATEAVYLLGEATRRPLTLDEYDVIRAVIRRAEAASPAALDADRLTAIIESRMSRDLAWLDDDGKTVTRFGPDQVAHALLHLYRTGDVVSGLPPLSEAASPAALDFDALDLAISKAYGEYGTAGVIREYARLTAEQEERP